MHIERFGPNIGMLNLPLKMQWQTVDLTLCVFRLFDRTTGHHCNFNENLHFRNSIKL
jgi:hypothetical protein